MKKTLVLAAIMLLAASAAFAQLGTGSATNTLAVNVGAEAGLTITTGGTTTLVEGTGPFANFTGTTGLTYYIRTKESGGSGSIVLQITTDFSPTGGPSVASPPLPSDALSYTCTAVAPGTACTGSVNASTTAATSVETFGAGAHSAKAGNSGNTVSWTLPNDPQYAVSAYTATVTFTISAA